MGDKQFYCSALNVVKAVLTFLRHFKHYYRAQFQLPPNFISDKELNQNQKYEINLAY